MVEPHVAGLARLRLLGLFLRKGMARVTYVAGDVSETRAPFLELQYFGLRLVTEPVTALAALQALSHGERLPVRRGHRLQRAPRERMLSSSELFRLDLVTLATPIRVDRQHFISILRRRMVVTMADSARHLLLCMLAPAPVSHDARSHILVAGYAILLDDTAYGFDGPQGLHPFAVPAFHYVCFRVAHFHQFQRHPGAGRFRRSGSVDDERHLLGIFRGP